MSPYPNSSQQQQKSTPKPEMAVRAMRIERCLTNIATHSLDPNKQDCPICLHPLISDSNAKAQEPPVRINLCGHIFGKSCITRWLGTHDTCPSCRATILIPQLTSLDHWRSERASITKQMSEIYHDVAQPLSRWRPAVRLQDFVFRYTGVDAIPSYPMQHYILSFANDPTKMDNAWMQDAILHLDRRLVEQAESFDGRMREEVGGLQRVLAVDIVRHGGKDLYGHAGMR